jgi:putative PEP-CTERM system histidine kinase
VLELSFGQPGAASYGFAALAFALFAMQLALGWRGGAKAVMLLGAVGASGLWALSGLGYALTASPILWRAQAVTDGLRIAGWLLFAIALLASPRRLRWELLALVLLPAAAWLLPQAPPSDAVADPAQARLPFGFLLAVAVAGLVLTEQLFRRAGEQARWSIKPLCLGLGASFVFDLYVYADALLVGRLDGHLWAARGLAQALVIPFIAVATVRNKDWTIDIALSRGVVFHSTALLACGVYLLGVSAAGYYVRFFGGSWGKTFQVGFVFVGLLLLGWMFSSGTLRSRLRVFINKHFFPYRYDYREEWLRFTSLLSKSEPGASSAQRSIEALANLVESPAGALWLQDDSGVFVQTASWNLPPSEARESADASLPRFLSKTGWVISMQEYRDQPSRYAGLELPGWLRELASAWVIVPIIAQESLIGFVVLAKPRAEVELNWEVLDLLKTAARQVGSFLAQIRASEALIEARKFDAFNKMSAFVVHDLKNLVAQLSLLLKNAERHRQNPRFQEDMLSTVRHVSERVGKLMVQLSAGSGAEEGLRPIDLGKLVERVVAQTAADRADIAVETSERIFVVGRQQRFERVIGHLVQNAIDATRTAGSVRIGVSAEQGRALLEVADTGCGMTEEFVRERLFRPFETTKPKGMGIGAFETAQVVREMGGTIQTDSRQGSGTRIRVFLPLHPDHAARGEQTREAA